MSMHKMPLTDLEKQGLVEHGLSIDSPSQLSDSFRLGIQFATKNFNKTVMQLSKEKCALQAKIDALMLEFCPEEMTKDQIKRWQENQEISTWSANGVGLDSLLNLNPASREIYGNDKFTKPNHHCYWDSNYQCWTEDDNHFRNRLKV